MAAKTTTKPALRTISPEDVQRTSRGRKPKYDYDTLLGTIGQWQEALGGSEKAVEAGDAIFSCKPDSFAQSLQGEARERGLMVEAVKLDNSVQFLVSERTDENGEPVTDIPSVPADAQRVRKGRKVYLLEEVSED